MRELRRERMEEGENGGARELRSERIEGERIEGERIEEGES